MALTLEADDSTDGRDPKKACVLTLKTATFNYSFKTFTCPNGATHSLMADQRKHLEHGFKIPKDEAGSSQAWSQNLQAEMGNLQQKSNEWLWELEDVEQVARMLA
ncbi:MAG: hypothetical protein Q9169_005400 [Polycauliona sp. 2 TL-2023]